MLAEKQHGRQMRRMFVLSVRKEAGDNEAREPRSQHMKKTLKWVYK